jgi:hypothetical protein
MLSHTIFAQQLRLFFDRTVYIPAPHLYRLTGGSNPSSGWGAIVVVFGREERIDEKLSEGVVK